MATKILVDTDSTQTLTGKTLTAPTITGTVAGGPTITAPTITSPTITGTVAGSATYTAPVLSGTITGTYSLGGTPTITIADANLIVTGSSDATKIIKLEADGMAASRTLTVAGLQTTSQTLNIPDITASDTIVTTGLTQTITGIKTITNPTLAAGTTAVPSMTITNGSLLTSQTVNVIENDGVAMYLTSGATQGRGHIPARQYFRLTSDGTAISSIDNFFGAVSNIVLVSGGHYLIKIVMYYLKSTAGTHTITLTNSAAPTNQTIAFYMSPVTGVVAPPGTSTELQGHFVSDATAARTIVTGSLSNAVDHYACTEIMLINSTGTSLRIQSTASVGTITPRSGSYWIATRLPAGNSGLFAA
jgi:hypothetical protein